MMNGRLSTLTKHAPGTLPSLSSLLLGVLLVLGLAGTTQASIQMGVGTPPPAAVTSLDTRAAALLTLALLGAGTALLLLRRRKVTVR